MYIVGYVYLYGPQLLTIKILNDFILWVMFFLKLILAFLLFVQAKYLSSTYTANLPSSTILRPSFHCICSSKSSTISLLFTSVMSSGDLGFRLANLPFFDLFCLEVSNSAILLFTCQRGTELRFKHQRVFRGE